MVLLTLLDTCLTTPLCCQRTCTRAAHILCAAMVSVRSARSSCESYSPWVDESASAATGTKMTFFKKNVSYNDNIANFINSMNYKK